MPLTYKLLEWIHTSNPIPQFLIHLLTLIYLLRIDDPSIICSLYNNLIFKTTQPRAFADGFRPFSLFLKATTSTKS